MMRTVLKVSVFCWGIVIAFCLFFLIPFEALSPLAAAVLSVLVGGGLLVWQGFYVRRLHKEEGFEAGWFLAHHHGFWRVFAGAVGLALFAIGGAWLLAPRQIEQQLERGAMPVAAFLVVLFWFSLITTFLGFTVVCYAESVGYLRIRFFKSAAGSFVLATFWLGLATLFCSLFLEVINDNFLSLSGPTQNTILGSFALAVALIGLGVGIFQDLHKLLPKEDLEQQPQKRTT